jgi:hypothetical protein
LTAALRIAPQLNYIETVGFLFFELFLASASVIGSDIGAVGAVKGDIA